MKLVLLALLAPALLLPQNEPVAVLLRKQGGWTLDGKAVSQGASLRAGQWLRLPAGDSGAIKVLFFDGQKPLDCDSEGKTPCTETVVKPPSAPTANSEQRLWKVLSGISTAYLRTGTALSRAGGVADQIAEIRSSELRLQERLGSGGAITFSRIDATGSPGPVAARAVSSGGLTVAAKLVSGLYRVDVLDSSGKPSGDYLWLLALTGAAFSDASADYRLLSSRLEQWPDNEAGSKIRILRAFLLSRASEAGNR